MFSGRISGYWSLTPRTNLKHLKIPALNLNSRTDVNGPARKYQVSESFKTLQEAADAAQGGDLVAVMPGHYAGFVLEEKSSAGDNRYIHFKAMGEPGDVVIDQPRAFRIG